MADSGLTTSTLPAVRRRHPVPSVHEHASPISASCLQKGSKMCLSAADFGDSNSEDLLLLASNWMVESISNKHRGERVGVKSRGEFGYI